MHKWIALILTGLIALPATAAEQIAPIKQSPRLQPPRLERPMTRLPQPQPEEAVQSAEEAPEEAVQSAEEAAEAPAEQPAEAQPATPAPVTITAVDMTVDNCQYRWSISFRNDSDATLTNLIAGGKQKGPHLNTFHGAGGVLVSSIAPGQEITRTIGWARDIRATQFYVFVAESETRELATQPYDIPALSASIGQISFAHQSGSTYSWTAEIDNPSTIPVCGGITIVRKRHADNSMALAAPNTRGLAIPPGASTLSGTWDASNATGFNLRLSADSGAARGAGIWMLDEKEVPFTL